MAGKGAEKVLKVLQYMCMGIAAGAGIVGSIVETKQHENQVHKDVEKLYEKDKKKKEEENKKGEES